MTSPDIFGVTTGTNVDPTSNTTRKTEAIRRRHNVTKDSNKVGKVAAAKVESGL